VISGRPTPLAAGIPLEACHGIIVRRCEAIICNGKSRGQGTDDGLTVLDYQELHPTDDGLSVGTASLGCLANKSTDEIICRTQLKS